MKRLQAPTLVVVPVLALVVILLSVPGVMASLSATRPSPPPALRPARTGTPVPASALVRQSNPGLGYSIGLPANYRRAGSRIDDAHYGGDLYSSRSAQLDADLCRQERQTGSQSAERVDDVQVIVYPNPEGTSPVDFANAPTRKVAFTSVEATTVNGLSAARVVQQPSGDSAFYVIAGNSRLYQITPVIVEQPTTNPIGWLDGIASTFKLEAIAGAALVQSACP